MPRNLDGWATEHEFPLPDDSGVWLVRAYEFPTGELAYAEWERIQGSLRGTQEGNFSLWRTMTPDTHQHMVVVCGRPEHLPEVGGEPYDIDYENACAFAMRRARAGLDAPDQAHVEQEAHYVEPMQIDPLTGYVKRYRQR